MSIFSFLGGIFYPVKKVGLQNDKKEWTEQSCAQDLHDVKNIEHKKEPQRDVDMDYEISRQAASWLPVPEIPHDTLQNLLMQQSRMQNQIEQPSISGEELFNYFARGLGDARRNAIHQHYKTHKCLIPPKYMRSMWIYPGD